MFETWSFLAEADAAHAPALGQVPKLSCKGKEREKDMKKHGGLDKLWNFDGFWLLSFLCRFVFILSKAFPARTTLVCTKHMHTPSLLPWTPGRSVPRCWCCVFIFCAYADNYTVGFLINSQNLRSEQSAPVHIATSSPSSR